MDSAKIIFFFKNRYFKRFKNNVKTELTTQNNSLYYLLMRKFGSDPTRVGQNDLNGNKKRKNQYKNSEGTKT